jgi:hypothetical protein
MTECKASWLIFLSGICSTVDLVRLHLLPLFSMHGNNSEVGANVQQWSSCVE